MPQIAGLTGLSRKKSIKVLEEKLEENLEMFLENKSSNLPSWEGMKDKVLDLKEQLKTLKEKEKQKKQKTEKKPTKRDEMDEDNIAELMFAEGDITEQNNQLFERRASTMSKKPDLEDVSDSDSDSSIELKKSKEKSTKSTPKKEKEQPPPSAEKSATIPMKVTQPVKGKKPAQDDDDDQEWKENLEDFLKNKTSNSAIQVWRR